MMHTPTEKLLLQANPVGDAEQMRLPAGEAEARCTSILERRDAMTAPTSTHDETVRVRESRPRLQPALAFSLGLVVILAAVGGIILWVGGGGDELVNEPIVTTVAPTTVPPTTQPPPTTLPAALDGKIEVPAYADVPSFTAIVDYYEHDPATGETGWQATVAVRHAGPMAFEVTVLEESGESQTLGGSETLFFGDGSDLWVLEGGYVGPFPMPFEPFRHLFFDAENRLSAWDDICGSTPDELGIQTIAGRTATHVICSSDLVDYELWIDEESGLVLKMIGPLGTGDYSPYLARDGLFEFTDIAFEPVATPAAPAPVLTGAELAIPPLHMIWRDSGAFWMEYETWYFDGRTLRETVIDAADPSHVGGFTFAVDGQAGGCFPSEGICEVEDVEEGQTYGLFDSHVPEDLVADNCAEPTDGTVADRPARHYTCDGLTFLSIDTLWRATVDVNAGVSDYWFDTATGLNVKVETPTWGREATLLETNPQFPAGIFQYETPDWAVEPVALRAGDLAPVWSGPLLGGGTFSTADFAGKHLVLFNWLPGCGERCLDDLLAFQRLSEEYGTGSAVFVSVSDDVLSETDIVVERLGLTIPTVYCGWDPDQVCFPSSPWLLWGNSIPSVTVIGPDGVVGGVFQQPPVGAELEDVLISTSG